MKNITKDYYEKYISILSEKLKINNEKDDYISIDICNFIKKFISKHKENLDIESLNQYLREDKENFYLLMDKILNSRGVFKDEIVDNLKEVFNEINVIRENSNEVNDNKSSETVNEIIEDEGENNLIVLKKEYISGDNYNLINGDDIILDKINARKKKKKVSTLNFSNLLDDLEINNDNS